MTARLDLSHLISNLSRSTEDLLRDGSLAAYGLATLRAMKHGGLLPAEIYDRELNRRLLEAQNAKATPPRRATLREANP